MKTSAGDDGDPATATLTKAFIIFLICLPFSVYKSHPKTQLLLKTATKKEIVARTTKSQKQKSKKKKLYLTFDDGPNRGTKNVFTIVKDEQVPVTFFIVGEHVFASLTQEHLWDSLKMMEHIALCNHSFCHANNHYEKYYQSPDSVVKDFQRTQDSLQFDNTVARTPGRNIWRIDTLQFTDLKKSAAAADSLQKAGFILMGWDLEWEFDHKTMNVTASGEKMVQSIDSMFKHGKTKNKGHLVLLAHDQAYVKSDDSLELRKFLQLLKQRDDYELMLATDYPGADKVQDTLRLQ